jgi:hypothetical protein
MNPVIIWNILKIGIPLLLMTGFYFHYQGLKADREELRSVKAEVEAFKEDLKIETQARVISDQSFEESRKDREITETILRKHQLDKLLQAKPNLIINRINNGTSIVFDELEELANSTMSESP